MKLEYRYTDACLERVERHIFTRIRLSSINPRYTVERRTIREFHFVHDKTGRKAIAPIDEYFVMDRVSGKEKVTFPVQFFNTRELQRQARDVSISIAIDMRYKEAVYGRAS